MIGAVVLAAGLAVRMGRPKVFLPLGGKPMLAWVVRRLLEGGAADVVVVLGPSVPQGPDCLAGLPVRWVRNDLAALGMSTSIRAGLGALRPEVEAAFVALGDQPAVAPAALRALAARYREGRAAVVVPSYRGFRGNPVLFDRSVFPELQALEGDVGGRAVVDRDPSRVAVVELDLPPPEDVDTPEDYARMVEAWRQGD